MRSPKQSFKSDEAVTEIVGYTLTFGILSAVLVLSLLSFGAAKDATQERILELRTESVAQRVAGSVVAATLLVEGSDVNEYRQRLELPEHLESVGYVIEIEADAITVTADDGTTSSEPLLGAGTSVDLCLITVPGGPLDLVFTTTGAVPAGCTAPTMFLEEP